MARDSHFEIDKTTHPIYQVIGPVAQNRIKSAKRRNEWGVPEEFHPILDQAVEDVLQKLTVLYDVAINQPRAFQILRAKHVGQGPEKAREFLIKTHEQKRDRDDLTRKYVDIFEHHVINGQQNDERYGIPFTSAISSIVTDGYVFTKESVERKLTMQSQGLKSALKNPKAESSITNSVTWKEDLEEAKKIPARNWATRVLQEIGGRGK
jgi:hypothetical protein